MLSKKGLKNAAFHRPALARVMAEAIYRRYRRQDRMPVSLVEAAEAMASPEVLSDKRRCSRLYKDLIFSCLCYKVTYKEYFLYRFSDLHDKDRRRYVGWYELRSIYKQLDSVGRPDEFNQKDLTWSRFREYFRRDALPVLDASQKAAFLDFAASHRPCFLKPLLTYGGKGIVRIDTAEESELSALFDAQIRSGAFLAEEEVRQAPEMARFHPSSVNTIRYNTFYHNGKLYRLQAALRMGRSGSFVDNASSGGIYALVDTETGVITGPARSDKNELFTRHPDTGVQINGAQIPRWDELNELLERIVRVIPEQKLVGWDFALSVDGWVLVEANSHPAIQSFDLDYGLREWIKEIIGRVVPIKG